MTITIDLNCDLGEGCDNDVELLDHITSANIACGFHAGGPSVMAATVKAAAARGVAIGAHPGLQDLEGFGRRELAMTPEEVYQLTVYQIGALQAFTRAADVPLHHVKPHGALYNMAARDGALADAIAHAVRDVDASLKLYALSGSQMVRAGRDAGLTVVCEVFADRSYQDDGSLTPRSKPGAMITEADRAIAQVLRMVNEGRVRSQSGQDVAIEAGTVCLHGDQPDALEFAVRLRAALASAAVRLQAA